MPRLMLATFAVLALVQPAFAQGKVEPKKADPAAPLLKSVQALADYHFTIMQQQHKPAVKERNKLRAQQVMDAHQDQLKKALAGKEVSWPVEVLTVGKDGVVVIKSTISTSLVKSPGRIYQTIISAQNPKTNGVEPSALSKGQTVILRGTVSEVTASDGTLAVTISDPVLSAK